jgi:hypothetical protein
MKEELIDYIEIHYPDAEIILADGFEDAFIGIGQQFNNYVAIYDRDKCINILHEDMDYEEAEEYFEYNVVGAYVGEGTPVFVELK